MFHFTDAPQIQELSAHVFWFMATQAVICQLDLNFVPFRQQPADDGSVLKICLAKKSKLAHSMVATLGKDDGLSQFIHWMKNVDIPDSAVAHKRVHWASLSVTCPKDGKPLVSLLATGPIPAFRSEIAVVMDLTVSEGPIVQMGEAEEPIEPGQSGDEHAMQASPADGPDREEEDGEDVGDGEVERPAKRAKTEPHVPPSQEVAKASLQQLTSGTVLEESEDGFRVVWENGHVVIHKSEPGKKLKIPQETALMICVGKLQEDGQSHTGIVFNPNSKTKAFCFVPDSPQPKLCSVASLIEKNGLTGVQGKGALASGKIPRTKPVMHFVPDPEEVNFLVLYWAVQTGVLNNDWIKSTFVTWMTWCHMQPFVYIFYNFYIFTYFTFFNYTYL